jgi:hypothetical protein
MNLEPLHQLKVPVVRRSGAYTLFLEQARPELTFIHCDVEGRWTKSLKLRLIEDFKTLKSLHGGPIFALHPAKDEKHLKFLQMFGFKKVTDEFIGRADGLPYHVFMTSKDPS